MNYYFTGLLIVLFCLLALFVRPAHSGSTQSNVSGSNTAIEGGYESTATTTYQSVSSSNTTTNSTSNSNIRSAPPTASAPSFSAQSQDVCATGVSVGIQTFGTGFSGGKTNRDMNCERIKLAKVLYDFGMNVGCLINQKSMAFNYAKNFKTRFILGCGIILNGIPRLLPIVINKKGDWIGKIV